MDINKLKAEVKKNIKNSDSTKKKLLYVFTRQAFRKNLKLDGCISSGDLKPSYKTFYEWLNKKYQDFLVLEPHYTSMTDFCITAYMLTYRVLITTTMPSEEEVCQLWWLCNVYDIISFHTFLWWRQRDYSFTTYRENVALRPTPGIFHHVVDGERLSVYRQRVLLCLSVLRDKKLH